MVFKYREKRTKRENSLKTFKKVWEIKGQHQLISEMDKNNMFNFEIHEEKHSDIVGYEMSVTFLNEEEKKDIEKLIEFASNKDIDNEKSELILKVKKALGL